MEKFILDVLGPFATAWLLLPLVIVVIARHAIRKRHIVALLAGVAVASGASVGYCFILKSLGLASLGSKGTGDPRQ